jgi:hypothetical protein
VLVYQRVFPETWSSKLVGSWFFNKHPLSEFTVFFDIFLRQINHLMILEQYFFCFGNPNLQAISTGWWWSESPVEFRSFFDVCVKSTDDPNPHIIGLTPGNPGWDDGKDLVDPRTSKDGMIWWFILTVKNDFQLKRLRATRKYPAG